MAGARFHFENQPKYFLEEVLEGKKSLQEIIESVRPGIKMVLGSKSGSQMFANLDSKTQAGIVQLFSALEENFDYMIVDAKAGDDDSVLGYLVAAQRRLFLATPHIDSITDMTWLIKKLQSLNVNHEIYTVLTRVKSQAQAIAVGNGIKRSLSLEGTPPEYLGSIEEDELVGDAVNEHIPYIDQYKGSSAARDVKELAKWIVQHPLQDGPEGGIQFFIERLVD